MVTVSIEFIKDTKRYAHYKSAGTEGIMINAYIPHSQVPTPRPPRLEIKVPVDRPGTNTAPSAE